MQPAGRITGTLGVHQAHTAAGFMPPTSGPNVPTVAASACPVLALPNAAMHDRLQSHYAASTSLGRLHNGLHLPATGVTAAAYAAHVPGASWPPVPPVAQAPQPTSNPPVASLAPPPPITPTPQQHLLPQLFWQPHKDLTSGLSPNVPVPSIPLPQTASHILPGDVVAAFCRRLERNKESLALEDSKYRIAERDLQEATAVLRRAEQLPKLQAKVWSFLDENDVIHRELSLLQLTAVLKGAPQTQVENSATGESLPFVDAIAATPLRNCVLERNAMRERVVVLEGTICQLLAEGRAIALEVRAAEFAALADRLASARWLPATAASASGLHDAGGFTPEAVRMQLIAGKLAPDDLLLPAAMAGAQPVPSALKPATEVVADWEGALHESQQRQVAAKAAAAEGAGQVLKRLRLPAQNVKAWTYLSGGRPTEPFSFLELCAWLEAGKLDAYALVAAEQLLGDGEGSSAGARAVGEEVAGLSSGGPRWLLLAELIRMYGWQKRGDMPPAPAPPIPPPMTTPPDPMFGLAGVQQPLSVLPGVVGMMPPMAAVVGSACSGSGGSAALGLSLHHPGHRLLPGASLPLSISRSVPCPTPLQQQQQPPPLAACGSMPLPCGPSPGWCAEGCSAVPSSTGPQGGLGMGATIHFPPLATVRSHSELLKPPKSTSSASLVAANDEGGSPTSQQRARSSSFSGHSHQSQVPLHRLGSSQQQQQQVLKRPAWQPPRAVPLQRSASPPLPPPPPLLPQHRAATPPLSRHETQRPEHHLGPDAADAGCVGEPPQRQCHPGKPPLRPGAQGPLPPPSAPSRLHPSHAALTESCGAHGPTAAPSLSSVSSDTALTDDGRRGMARPSQPSSLTANGPPGSRTSGPGTLTDSTVPVSNGPPRIVNPALVSHAVRMTKLQFLERVRSHLPRLLSGMIEGAYCEYRLKMLDTQEQEDQSAANAANADNAQSEKHQAGVVQGEGVVKPAGANHDQGGAPPPPRQQQQQGPHPVPTGAAHLSAVKIEKVEEAQPPNGAPPKQDAGVEGDVTLAAAERHKKEQDLKPVADGSVCKGSNAAEGAPYSVTTGTGSSGSPRTTGSRPRRSGRLNSPTSFSGAKATTTPVACAGNTADVTASPPDAGGAFQGAANPETLDLVHDLFEEMLMLALFTVEAQREAVVRPTRSRRQAAPSPAGGSMPAALGGSGGGAKSRRDAHHGASDEPPTGHPAKRQRQQGPKTGGAVGAWSRATDASMAVVGDTAMEVAYTGSRKGRERLPARRSEAGSEEGLGEALKRVASGAMGDVSVGLPDGEAAAAARRQEGATSEGDGGSGTAAGGDHQQAGTRPSKKSQHQARRPAKRARRESRSGGLSDDRVGSPETGDDGGGNHTLNDQALESAPEPHGDGEGDMGPDRPSDGNEAGMANSPPQPPPPQRPPRHRGISAKELRSLADGAAPELAAVLAAAGGTTAGAAAATDSEAVHGGLVLGGDLQPLRGRRTRAAAAAAAVNAVAAIAAEALASMSDSAYCAASMAQQAQRDWDPAPHARSNSRVFSQSEPQQLSPTRGMSEALGTTQAGDDEAEALDSPFRAVGMATGKRRSGGVLGGSSSGAPVLARSHRSLDSMVTELEAASWQGATAAGRPSRRGSESGRRPPSRTSSCTQEHLEGWHSALFPGKPYGKAMRNDSLTMLLEASLMAFGGGAATAVVATTTAHDGCSPCAENCEPVALNGDGNGNAAGTTEPQLAADVQQDACGGGDGGDDFDGGAPSVPKHARGPRSARAGSMRRRSNGAVLAAVLEGHPAAIMTEGRRRRYPPPPGSSSAEAATTGAAQAVDQSVEVGPDEEMPALPWAEEVGGPLAATGGPHRNRPRGGSTTPPLPPNSEGAALAAGVGMSGRRSCPRASPLPAGEDTTGATVGTTSACHRTPTPMGMSEGGPSGCSDAAQDELRTSGLGLLEWNAGVSRGLPLQSMQALKLSHGSPAPALSGERGNGTAVASAALVRNGASGAAMTAASMLGAAHRARAASSEHRFLTMAAAGGAAGTLGASGGRGHASAEHQQVIEVAKWRLQAARAKKLKFGRSRIAGWGLFAVEPIEESEFVIEYCGELIRKPLDDVRQRKYDSAGFADYMFAVGDGLVIDATLTGNAARYINHCCDPNCEARVVEVGGERRIAIFALRRIEADEELHYDYKLSCMEGEERIPCGCGARNCKKFMN